MLSYSFWYLISDPRAPKFYGLFAYGERTGGGNDLRIISSYHISQRFAKIGKFGPKSSFSFAESESTCKANLLADLTLHYLSHLGMCGRLEFCLMLKQMRLEAVSTNLVQTCLFHILWLDFYFIFQQVAVVSFFF